MFKKIKFLILSIFVLSLLTTIKTEARSLLFRDYLSLGTIVKMNSVVGNSDMSKLLGFKNLEGGSDYLYTSTDQGITWSTSTNSGVRNWRYVAISENGTKMLAYSLSPGFVYISNDGGTTWATSTTVLGSKLWWNASMSKDGSKIFINEFFGNSYYSTNGGTTWATSTGITAGNYTNLAQSDDGTNLVMNNFISTTTGATWFSSTATSSIGLLKYASSTLYMTKSGVNYMYKSTDNGITWSTVNTLPIVHNFFNNGSFCQFNDLFDVSTDGTKIITVCSSGFLLFSKDSGITWSTENIFESSGWFTLGFTSANKDRYSLIKNNTDTRFLFYPKSIAPAYKYDADTSYINPLILNITPTGSSTTLALSHNSSIRATSTLSYGFGNSMYRFYQGPVSKFNSSTTLSFTLLDLIPCATYDYYVDISDIYENIATSTLNSFKTSGCIANAPVIEATSTAIITTSGGVINLNNLRLVIPAAYTSTASSSEFEVTQVATTTVIAALGSPTGSTLIGDLYQLQAMLTATSTISTFDLPLFLVMNYNPAMIGSMNPDDFKIYSTDGAGWTPLASCVTNKILNTVTCSTTHFSTFGIFNVSTVPVVSTPAPYISYGGSSGGGSYTPALSLVKNSTTTTATSTVSRISGINFKFNNNLRFKINALDVMQLQKYLNSTTFKVALFGKGSTGKESYYFGLATKSALIKYQKSVGLPATGFFGPMTRSIIN